MKYTMYEIGGCVRDYLLNIPTKDIDYVVVMEGLPKETNVTEAYNSMKEYLRSDGFEIFKEKEDCFTITARFPKDHKNFKIPADFVLSRKETGFIPNTRQPIVELGTLEDDILRRDFTINSMAFGLNGEIIDLHGGQKDLLDRIIRTNIDASISFRHDPLRILRAMRFAITKNLDISEEIWKAIELFDLERLKVVSVDRRREELNKMLHFDTPRTLHYLDSLNLANGKMYDWLFSDGLKLTSTTKLKP